MPIVTLISYTPDPVRTVAAAAKLCYSRSGIETLLDNLDEHKANDFVEMLSDLGHESPIEHASFTFGIEGVSRAFLAQITRHRLASYSVQSQRYVEKQGFDYVTPPEIAGIPEAAAEYGRIMDECAKSYETLTSLLKEKHERELVKGGMDPKEAGRKAAKMAIEDARFVLPNACDTRMVVTMNARSLHNFFKQRLCNRAQWEIRAVAEQMYRLVYAVAPVLFAHAGPPCADGPCPEGKMSCGQMAAVKEKYRLLRGELRGK